MKHKISELEGALLDAAVAKAEGLSSVKISHGKYCMAVLDRAKSARMDVYEPSSNWSHGGRIIELERINVGYDDQGGTERGLWSAYVYDGNGSMWFADTPLIAAMRAYIASKFGEEIEL